MFGTLGARLTVVTLLVTAAVGCNDEAGPVPGPTGTASPSPSPTPLPGPTAAAACDLLTAEEIAMVVGNPVGVGASAGPADCTWASHPEQVGVSMLLIEVPDVETCTSGREPGSESIVTLGAEAWWTFLEVEGGVGTVVACPAGYQVSLTIVGPQSGSHDEARLRTAAERLAASALGGLGVGAVAPPTILPGEGG